MSAMNPDSLRALLQALEPLRGHVIASGHIEDGTDTSVGADLLLDDGYAHADAWQSDRRANAALRERLIEAGEAMRQALSDLEWVERQSPGSNFQASILLLRKRIASLPESISLSPDGPTDHLGETEDKP